MAYDEELANRIRELVAMERGLTEQRMFGGARVSGWEQHGRGRQRLEPWVRRGVGYARSLPPKR